MVAIITLSRYTLNPVSALSWVDEPALMNNSVGSWGLTQFKVTLFCCTVAVKSVGGGGIIVTLTGPAGADSP